MPRVVASLIAVAALAGCALVVDGDPPRSCTLGAGSFEHGAVIDAGDGCNRCTCDDGRFRCTQAVCSPALATCVHQGAEYTTGERFSVDACNTCLCGPAGALACTTTVCTPPACLVEGVRLSPGQTLVSGACTWTCGDDGVASSLCDPDGCVVDGVRHDVGTTFPAADGGTCTCELDGTATCVPPPVECSFAGAAYRPGELFTLPDGCNRCRCEADGSLTCTDGDCAVAQEGWFELPIVRVAFVVSNREGTSSLHDALTANVGAILAPADGRGMQRLLAVTSTARVPDGSCDTPEKGADNGRFLPLDPQRARFHDPDAPEPWTFSDLTAALGACHHVEEGIATALRATSRILAQADDPLTPLENDGNHRFALDGKLAVVWVTNDDDVTQGELDQFARELRNVRGDRLQNQLSFHLVMGPPGEACDSRAALRYRDLVDRLDGTVEYACTGFSSGDPWTRLGVAAFHYDMRVLLDDVPHDLDGDGDVTDEIEVTMNGAPYPPVQGGTLKWRYAAEPVAIDFASGHAPLPGTPYTIRYRVAPVDPR